MYEDDNDKVHLHLAIHKVALLSNDMKESRTCASLIVSAEMLSQCFYSIKFYEISF